MRFVIVVSVDNAEQACELAGMPLLPDPGDTVQIAGHGGPIVGVVKERHFAYQAPDVCRVTLACRRL
jgi:hypothetical protein